jgi:hypothetical protein
MTVDVGASTNLVVKWLGKFCLWSMGLGERNTRQRTLYKSNGRSLSSEIVLLEMKGRCKGGSYL